MFGQPGNQSFGNYNATPQSSPFGQSAFGKSIAPNSFGTGTTPVFGTANTSLFNSKPAGTSTGGLFGSTTSTSAFGQPTTTQSSFGFGNTSTNTNLFGSNQNANTSLFGATTNTPAFGQQAQKPGFSFGSTSSAGLFGQPQQQNQQVTPFGSTSAAPSTNLFSSTTGMSSGFGAAPAATGVTGTVVKFNPVTGNDTMMKNGVTHNISTRHYAITTMKEYENKCFEELRLEDYVAGRKGTTTGQSTGLFGATPAQPSLFGSNPAGTSTASTSFGTMSSGFGSQSTGSNLFGKPAIAGFGATTTTSSAFPFSSTSQNTNLFGSNTQQKPFGAAPAPLFSTPNNAQPTGMGFGLNTTQNTGFSSGFGATQPNQQQSIGLFNQNKSAFNIPASTAPSFGFSAPAATNTGSNLFGAKPAGTTGFAPSFGTTPAPAFGATTFNTTQPSLFNSSFKSTGQAPAFSFGNTTATSTGLGTNTSLNLGTGSSLFGQPKPGGLFGNTNTTTPFNSTGTFGASAGFGTGLNTTSGLGMNLLGGSAANQSQQNSSAASVHQQILALVADPFGDSPLLKNLLPASGKTEELLKPANPGNRSLSSPQYKVASNSGSKIKARVVTSSHLSKKSLFEGLEEEDPTLLEAFQPRPNAKRLVLRPKPLAQTSTDNLNSSKDNENKEDTANASLIENGEAEVTDKENQQDERQLGEDRRSSTSWLLRKKRISDNELLERLYTNARSPFGNSSIVEETLENTIDELRPRNIPTQSESLSNMSIGPPGNISLQSDKNKSDSIDLSREHDESVVNLSTSQYEENLAKVTLRRAGYYTIPPIDKLEDYVRGETCIVPNFTIGRKEYGNVFFPDSFDIYGLNLDEIVHFRHKEVIIYPDDDKKPPVGDGLNRRAQVTLDHVWPIDKSLHEPITDPTRLIEMNYEAKLRRVSAKHDTRFLEYRPETGSWVFKVDHFSKYGLSDSDDDDEPPPNSEAKKLKGATLAAHQQKTAAALKQLKQPLMKQGLNGSIGSLQNGIERLQSELIDDTNMETAGYFGTDYNFEKQTLSPTTVSARLMGTDSHKLQLMKASFFDEDCGDMMEETCQSLYSKSKYPTMEESMNEVANLSAVSSGPLLRSNLTLHQGTYVLDKDSSFGMKDVTVEKVAEPVKEKPKPIVTSKKTFTPAIVRPKVAVLKFRSQIIPLKDSKLNFQYIADAGIQMGRMFKPSWGPGLSLVSLSTQDQAAKIPLHNAFSQLGLYVSGRLFEDTTSSSIVQRLRILGGCGADPNYVGNFKESIEGHLRIQLEHCTRGHEGDCPAIGTATKAFGVDALHAHFALATEQAQLHESNCLTSYTSEVWKLCVALWGKLPDIHESSDDNSHHNVMVRREAFGEWLKNAVEETVQRQIAEVENDDQKILHYLTAYKLEEACRLARNNGDYHLALLMAQQNGVEDSKLLIKQQLAHWQDVNVDNFIDPDRLKLFMLIAGQPLLDNKQGTINVCQNLDWRRALAVHLWFLSSPTSSITDVLEHYEKAFNSAKDEVYSAKPHPVYTEEFFVESTNGKDIYDLCFHIMKLYCTGNHSLEELLNPSTHTADPLDYRLSWLIQQVLVSLGYSYLSDYVAALTHTNFAAQLETYGLWHWAIFVVMHLKDTGRRRTAIMDLLARYIEIDETPDYVKREEFLKEELAIPSMWIDQAKAVKARAFKRYGEVAWYLIQAEQWNEAHEVIITHLAADAIINENYEYLRSLLSAMTLPECSSTISGWSYQGQLLWDYMEVASQIENLLQSGDRSRIGYHLEALQPQLTALCTKINLFPCPSAKHRLCQAEIAKRTLHLARSLLLLQADDERSATNVLVHLVSDLPLPEDYIQQELQQLVTCM